MKSKLFQNLSANALQLVINQLAGLVIFYLLSTGLNKEEFGLLNLALAILLMAFNLLSLGIDQISIRKIASGEDTAEILGLYLFHVLFTGLLFYGLLLCGSLLFYNTNTVYPLLLMVGAGKLMIYFSTPFKQAASGLERFSLIGLMLVVSNLARSLALVLLLVWHTTSLQNAVIVFIVGDILELAISAIAFRRGTGIPLRLLFNRQKYLALLRDALPQTGVNIITSAIARFDWVFIGITASAVKLAEYSFAYKVFEMSTLPLLAVAPLLIPKFTKMFKRTPDTAGLKYLVRIEMMVAAFTALALNMVWAPVMDAITHGKYGAVNSTTFFLLTLCIPLLYLNNFLWTIFFARGEMKMILRGFVISFLVNAGLDVALIPFFGNEGAAAAFLISCVVQAAFYLYHNDIAELQAIWQNLLACVASALIAGYAALSLAESYWLALFLASVIFILLLFATKQLKASDGRTALQLFSA